MEDFIMLTGVTNGDIVIRVSDIKDVRNSTYDAVVCRKPCTRITMSELDVWVVKESVQEVYWKITGKFTRTP